MDEYWKMGLTLDYYSISFRRMRGEREGKRKVVFVIKVLENGANVGLLFNFF